MATILFPTFSVGGEASLGGTPSNAMGLPSVSVGGSVDFGDVCPCCEYHNTRGSYNDSNGSNTTNGSNTYNITDSHDRSDSHDRTDSHDETTNNYNGGGNRNGGSGNGCGNPNGGGNGARVDVGVSAILQPTGSIQKPTFSMFC